VQQRQVLRLGVHALLVLGFWMLVYWQNVASAADQAEETTTIRIDVIEPSWVGATVDGVRPQFGILPAGSQREWSGQSIWLRISNAGGVQLTLNGVPYGVVGEHGEAVTLRWPGSKLEAAPVAAVVSPLLSPEPAVVNTLETIPAGEAYSETTTASYPTTYVVQPGDSLSEIALRFGTTAENLAEVNNIANPSLISVGMQLVIPGSDGSLPESLPAEPVRAAPARGSALDRMTVTAQKVPPDHNFYRTTWVTYYGRPNVPIMGVLGEHDIDELTRLLKEQAQIYAEANGPSMGVMPAFHLVYGMATRAAGRDGSHLAFLEDRVTEKYIRRAKQEGFGVILDIQIGALTPVEAMRYGFSFLHHENVHLAMDPEFAMSHSGQRSPGNPIGFVTAQELNEVQAGMQEYIEENSIPGSRILLVHQFLHTMLVDKDDLDWDYEKIDLTISVDGWGGPWGKISKYNAFVDRENTGFSAFKLFYQWDEPLLGEREALGVDPYDDSASIEVMPNLIIYQ
jgi:LysM repeat protein